MAGAGSSTRSTCWTSRMVGLDESVPLLDGRMTPYINLDNAASTPPLRDVVDAIQRFLPYYSSVHRGTGFKSRVSTAAYDEAHDTIARFVGADPRTQHGHLREEHDRSDQQARLPLPAGADSVVLSTAMEHHSNDLPWRGRARGRPGGRHRRRPARRGRRRSAARGLRRRVALLTVSGASNVTGFVQPIHRLARKAHAVGARILVDAAQLAPHRRIDVKPDDDPEHLDFVVLSAHKMYAPFGTGALVGRATCSCAARRNTRAAARSRSSRRPRCTGPDCPIARKPAARTSSARWRWRSPRRR